MNDGRSEWAWFEKVGQDLEMLVEHWGKILRNPKILSI